MEKLVMLNVLNKVAVSTQYRGKALFITHPAVTKAGRT
jgi:hypothetical protein